MFSLIKNQNFIWAALIVLFVSFIYFLSSPGETSYDYFSRLSQAFLNGNLYLEENPPWLNELIPQNGVFYVVYPPMPAIIMLPLVALFKGIITQTQISILLGSINALLVFYLIKRLKFSHITSFLVTIFFAFGTNHWYLSSVGSAWFIAHIVALFFLLLALLESFGKQRFLLIGLLIGASFWARTPVIFTTIFFYVLFWRKFYPISTQSINKFMLLNAGIIFFIALDALYNYLRFDNLSPFAPYNLIPNIENDPVFKDGFMSFNFIPRHLEALFLTLPRQVDESPFFIPTLYSSAIWFTSPAVVYILKFKKSLLYLSSWFGIIAPLSIIMLWAGVGYAQFGYRFAQDFMPFLLILVALGIGQKPSKLAYFLVGLSILVNLWAILMINKLNYFTI